MAIVAKQIFSVIVIKYDDAIFKEEHQKDVNKQLAETKIIKKSDATYFITIGYKNNSIDWGTHFPAANNVSQVKGLTEMTLT